MKKIKILLAVIALALLLGAVAVWALFDVNSYRGALEAELEGRLQRDVTLGEMHLGLLPVRLQLDNPVIGEAEGFPSSQPFLSARNLDVSVSLYSLIRGVIQIERIHIEQPLVELVKRADGVWNFASLGGPDARGGKAAGAADSESQAGQPFSLDRLTIHDGQIAVAVHRGEQSTRTVYDHIDLTLDNYAPGQAFSFDLAAHIQGQGAQEIRLKGEAGPVPTDDFAAAPFRGTLTVNEVGVEGLRQFLDVDVLSDAQGRLSGAAEIASQTGNLTAAGKLKVDGARVRDVDVGYPIELDYDLAAKLAEGVLHIRSATLLLGKTPFSVSGAVDMNASPVTMDLQMTSGQASISELARLASAFGIAFAPGADVAGVVSGTVRAQGPVGKPTLSGTVAARDLRISGKDVPQPVEVKSIDLALTPDEIRSNDFAVKSGQTTVAARFAIRQYTAPTPAIDVGLRAPSATLPEIQSIARAYGIKGLDRISGNGALNLNLNAKGPLRAMSSTEITRALNGDINLDFGAIRIAGFNAANELGAIGGFLQPQQANLDFTEILRLTGRLAVKNGIAETNNLRAQLDVASLAAAGTADLAAETLNLKVSAVFPKAVSDKAGGTGVAGYLKTALANSQGELVIPALVTGPFAKPKFAPDVQTFARMQRERLLPNVNNPAAAVSTLLDSLTRKQEGEGTKEESKPRDKLRGILDGLLGPKPAQQEK